MRAQSVTLAGAGLVCALMLVACGGGGGTTAAATAVPTAVEATIGNSFLPPDSAVTSAAALASDQLPPDAATNLDADQTAPTS